MKFSVSGVLFLINIEEDPQKTPRRFKTEMAMIKRIRYVLPPDKAQVFNRRVTGK